MARHSPATNRQDKLPRPNLSMLICTMTKAPGGGPGTGGTPSYTTKWFRYTDLINGASISPGGGAGFASYLYADDTLLFCTLNGDCTVEVKVGMSPVLITYNQRVETQGGSLISLTAQTPVELSGATSWSHTWNYTARPGSGNVTYLRDFAVKRLY